MIKDEKGNLCQVADDYVGKLFEEKRRDNKKFLGRLTQAYKTLLISSFAASVQLNQLSTTKKTKSFDRMVISFISDIYENFRMVIWYDPDLGTLGQTPLILQRQLQG